MQMSSSPTVERTWPKWLQMWPGALLLLLFFLILLSPLSLVFGSLLVSSEKWAWYVTRASGVVGYILLAASTIWGLLLSTKLVKRTIPAALSLAMHTYLSWISVAFVALHAFVLLFDSYFTYTVPHLLVPFTGPYKPMWVGLGTLSFYVMVLTSASFYVRRWIGQKNWRRFHYITFVIFWVVTAHSWVAGSDTDILQPLYIGSAAIVLFLTVFRII